MPMNSKFAYHPTSSHAPAFATAETILVVDDQPSLCRVATLFLERYGYRVLTANHVEVAKKIAHENADIDLLLADVEMPVLLGGELAEWFHITRPRTAVVFMSDHPMHHRRLQPCHFVERPFVHLDTLVKTIREALHQNRAAQGAASLAA